MNSIMTTVLKSKAENLTSESKCNYIMIKHLFESLPKPKKFKIDQEKHIIAITCFEQPELTKMMVITWLVMAKTLFYVE